MQATTQLEMRQWMKALLYVGIFLALCMFCTEAFASEGTEFADAANKAERWIKGNLGKLAALICVAVGAIVAAVKKDWSWFMGGIVLAIGLGIVVGIINASFTAVI